MRIEIQYERSKCKWKIVLIVRFFSLPLLNGKKMLFFVSQPTDAPSLVSPTSPSESLHDENELHLRHLDAEDQFEDVVHTSIVYTGAVLPTLHPDMQENLPILPSAR